MTLKEILVETFKTEVIPNDISQLKLGDIPGWDSVGNFNLILNIENHFEVQFEAEEMETLTSISAIEQAVQNALQRK